MTTRRLMSCLCAAAIGVTAVLPAARAADAYPAKPIRLVVPFPPGGNADVLARILAQGMTEKLGQTVMVDNKPGGNTIIGAETVAHAAPDGYTLLLAIDSTLTQNPVLYKKLPYDPAKHFAPVGLVAEVGNVLAVNAGFPAATVKQLIEQARTNPKGVPYGYGATIMQLAGEQFNQMTGVNMPGIAYKGGSTTVTAVMGGEIPVVFDGAAGVLANASSGKVRPLAVLGSRRLRAAPELPTVAEAGVPGYEVTVWQSLVAPAGTPRPVIDRINAAMRSTMADPATQTKLEKLGIEARTTSPEEMAYIVTMDTQKWTKVIRRLGLQLD